MRNILTLLLVLGLAACAPATPQTVVIVITATSGPAENSASAPTAAAPTNAPPPSAPTNTPAPAAPSDTPAPVVPAASPTSTLPPAIGGAVFTNFTRSGDNFSLRCSPGQVTFGTTAIDSHITSAYISYRMEDKQSTTITGWGSLVKMTGDGKGNFSINFSALDVNPDLRLANAWMDYQFVGLNNVQNVVGRSQIFEKQVTFTLDCQ